VVATPVPKTNRLFLRAAISRPAWSAEPLNPGSGALALSRENVFIPTVQHEGSRAMAKPVLRARSYRMRANSERVR